MRGRRRFGWCLMASRLPLLIIWTFILALLLYSLLDFSATKSDGGEEQYFSTSKYHEKISTGEGQPAKSQLLIMNSSDMKESDIRPTPGRDTIPSEYLISSTTRKSPISEYSRQSEIFILIIEEEDQRSKSVNGRSSQVQHLYPSSISSSTIHSKLHRHRGDIPHKLIYPNHIKILIEILDYHRIGYSIGTTRYGLPEQLLLAASIAEDERPYSVVVVDDFIKYTNLDRWLRDQLDRYCTSNQIGVITYLIDNHKPDHQVSSTIRDDSTTKGFLSTNTSAYERRWSAATNQFPLTYEYIEQDCRNDTSTNCLVDYRISDRTNILRILKSKKNYVIKGDLSEITDQKPLIAMSSNHITYEPLTWASPREPVTSNTGQSRRDIGVLSQSELRNELTNVRRKRRQQSGEWSPKPAALTNMVTQHTDRPLDDLATSRRQHARKRAVLPSPSEVTQEWFEGEMDSNDDDNMSSPSDEVVYNLSGLDEAQAPENVGLISPQGDQSSDVLLEDDVSKRRVLSMVDRGLYDGVRRVIFGFTNRHWANRILLLDAIEHLSSGQIMMSLDRYVQIDIDDIFVGERGTRLNRSDVEALVETQRQFAQLFDGNFKFNLGFSGKYFRRGNAAEQAGDDCLIEHSDKFTWFCHFWSHSKAHLMNSTEFLAHELEKNLDFARGKNLTLIGHRPGHYYKANHLPPTYAVAPHHSGVYPIHDDLYDAWRRVLNVQVTSTEEYPHLRPASGRRGFVHKNIRVLPRQVCGLYTHTIYKRKYPGGFNRLVASVRGGELFETLLHNPVNIYMTHMSNYANDRLAPYTFGELFKFVREHTNLRLRYAPTTHLAAPKSATVIDGGASEQLGPLQLANYYFDLYPAEREPLWTNPCQDKRHVAIWAPRKHQSCQVVPRILIVGPQKTGTTALHSFLRLNPLFKTSRPSAGDFEEVQFFNDKHYLRGVDWYFERFLASDASDVVANLTKGGLHQAEPLDLKLSLTGADDGLYYVDKSATYFDDFKVARRASSLLPHAIVVILLIDPADRAYSWYQHMKAHGDPIATSLTFEELLIESASGRRRRRHDKTPTTAKLDSARQKQLIQALRSRCLHPGYYSSHLSNWLQHFDSRQVVIIDGEWFKYNPVAVLNRFQALLRISQPVDYSSLLVYDERKGFFCERLHDSDNRSGAKHQSSRNQTKCLGSGKGRKYESMSGMARSWLNNHYLEHNKQLAKLLYEIGQPLPRWLDQSLSPLPMATT